MRDSRRFAEQKLKDTVQVFKKFGEVREIRIGPSQARKYLSQLREFRTKGDKAESPVESLLPQRKPTLIQKISDQGVEKIFEKRMILQREINDLTIAESEQTQVERTSTKAVSDKKGFEDVGSLLEELKQLEEEFGDKVQRKRSRSRSMSKWSTSKLFKIDEHPKEDHEEGTFQEGTQDEESKRG